MAAIFLCYRRNDAPNAAGRLSDGLARRFGAGRVFVDVDDIDVGDDFEARIDTALSKCSAFLVVIGRKWLTASDKAGNRRLDDPDDYVRREIERALVRDGVEVIPVLVDGAKLPAADKLPDALHQLTRHQAITLTAGPQWRGDVERLERKLAELFKPRTRIVSGTKSLAKRTRSATHDARDNLTELRGAKVQERTYRVSGLDRDQLVGRLVTFYHGMRLETQVISKPDGVLVQARSASGWRTVTAASAAINIGLQDTGNELTVTIAPGRWADKAVAFGISFVVLWPLAVTSSYGFFRQRNLIGRTFSLLDRQIEEMGGVAEIPDAADAPAGEVRI